MRTTQNEKQCDGTFRLDRPAVIAFTDHMLATGMAYNGPAGLGIPAEKLMAGRFITPRECRQATAQWRKSGAQPLAGDADRWEHWVHFIEVAAKHGGFEVAI